MKPLAFLSALLSWSCAGSGYMKDFKQAAAELPDPPTSAEGPWRGSWKSDVNGHEGPLWCIVSPNPDQPGHYDFRYRAGWGILSFGDYVHTAPVETGPDGSLRLDDAMELPGGFGNYQVEGKVTPTEFDAEYRAEQGDHGTFELQRP